MKLGKFAFALASLASIFGLPYCLFIFLAAARPEFPDITGETARSILPVPITIAALSLVHLFLTRGLKDRQFRVYRGWAIAYIMLALLMSLLLLTESPYKS